MFNMYLHERAERSREEFVAFDPQVDYPRYVEGKPRADGVRDS
jgi:trehalose 6-phosphate phosphatase